MLDCSTRDELWSDLRRTVIPIHNAQKDIEEIKELMNYTSSEIERLEEKKDKEGLTFDEKNYLLDLEIKLSERQLKLAEAEDKLSEAESDMETAEKNLRDHCSGYECPDCEPEDAEEIINNLNY